MTTEVVSSISKKIGWGLSIFISLFLLMDGITKVIKLPPVLEACLKLGLPEAIIAPIGIVLTLCTILYLVPATAILGAVLLTAYLGGAVATHVRAQGSLFEMVFPVICGCFVWGGLYVRMPALRRLLPLVRR